MKLHTLTIVGVGLIGGSIGLAARRRGLADRIVGVGRQRSTLDTAQAYGAIDDGTLDLAAGVAEADLVVFCTPVDILAEQALVAGASCRPGTLLTDAGSTKARIVAALEGRLPPQVTFVGSHPLAGSEKRGPEHADANLFLNRLTIVTPLSTSDPAAVERTCEFWQALGSRVHRMRPEDHDRALALTSHLPHLVASALAGTLPPELAELTATGFRDTTRIAAGDPALWTGIFLHNREALLDALERFRDRLEVLAQAIAQRDGAAIDHLLAEARKVRNALGS